jgi:hypothetical protein
MAWHMGHPLSQTIFTSLYIDKLLNSKRANLEDIHFGKLTDTSHDEPLNLRVLRAYCLGLIMTCSHVNNRVKSEHFYEVASPTLSQISLEVLTLDSRKRISSPTHIIGIYSKTFRIRRSFPASKMPNMHFLCQTWPAQNS